MRVELSAGARSPERRVRGRVRGGLAIEAVDFVSVPTRDLERAWRFYSETLGLSPSRYTPFELEASNVTLALWRPESDGVPFEPNTAGIALRVGDVALARRRLEEADVEFLGETVDTGVCHMAFCYDSEGNVLILHRRYRPRETRREEADPEPTP